MSKKRIVVLVILLVLLGCWWSIIHIPSVGTAFWDFCTLGILPWSGKPVSSEVVWRTLIGCFTVSFMLIFHREIVNSLPRRRTHIKQVRPKTMLQVATPPDVHTHPVASPVATVQQARKRDIAIITISKSIEKPDRQRIRPLLLFAARICILGVAVGDWLERMVRRVWRLMVRYGSTLLWMAARAAWRASLIIATAAILTWRFIEPHLRTFDQWLDRRLHQNATTAQLLRKSHDAWKISSSIYKKLHAQNKFSQQK